MNEKKTTKIQMFRPKDEEVLKRTSPDKIIAMAQDTIRDCKSWIKQKEKEWKKEEISDKEYKNEIERQNMMISDAKKTIFEVEKKEQKKGRSES